jgi:hypothetical protein
MLICGIVNELKKSITYLTAKLPDPAKLPLRGTPPDPTTTTTLKINSRAIVLELCMEFLKYVNDLKMKFMRLP